MAERRSSGHCYVPSDGPDAWQRFLSKPDLHWKTGHSAKALAHCWEAAGDRLPGEVASLIRSFPRYAHDHAELLLAVPEWIVPLPGGSKGSHNDVLALIGVGGDLMVAAVEGKVSERFGEETIEQWFSDPSPGKETRLRYLCDLLGTACPPAGHLRYQLFHRAASAVIECRRFRAQTPAMIVHSFSPTQAWFEDYVAFVEELGGAAALDQMSGVDLPDGSTLLLGWACGDEKYLKA